MESVMVLGLPGKELYCVTKTDQYYVFQNYFVRQRSARSPRDIRHAEISRYTPEASGHRKNAEVRDLRIPRSQVAARSLKMRRSLLTRWDNCGVLKLNLYDGRTLRFLILGNHSAEELREWFDIGDAGICGRTAQTNGGPCQASSIRNADIRSYLEEMYDRRDPKRRGLAAAAEAVIYLLSLFCAGLLVIPQNVFFQLFHVDKRLVFSISLTCLLITLVLPLVVPQWYSHMFFRPIARDRFGRASGMIEHDGMINVCGLMIFPLVGMTAFALLGPVYRSLWPIGLIAFLPSAVLALLLWILSKERRVVPVRMAAFCLAFAILGFGLGGAINRADEFFGPDRVEQVEIVARKTVFNGALDLDYDVVVVNTPEGELTFPVSDYRSFHYGKPATVNYYDGLLGIPFSTLSQS